MTDAQKKALTLALQRMQAGEGLAGQEHEDDLDQYVKPRIHAGADPYEAYLAEVDGHFDKEEAASYPRRRR